MRQKVRWGVLGVAKIATVRVIPAMQQGEWSEMAAIASRDHERAESAARALGIPRAYGTYEELLSDPDVEAIYNPLPNHLHVAWSIKALQAGKHVLCEKPISMSVAECRTLIEARDRTGLKIGEAFMVRTHPQWLRARELVRSGEIGSLRSVLGAFNYFNDDPANIRNIPECGGGALMDIGCYPVTISRFLYGEEPSRVLGLIERDPKMGTDRLTSAVMEFPNGQSVFSCSTQIPLFQTLMMLGTRGRVQVEIPFNAPPERPARLFIDPGTDLVGGGRRTEEFRLCNQYTIQGDLFSQAIREGGEVPVPLEDALRNMAVIEAIFRSSKTGAWEVPTIC